MDGLDSGESIEQLISSFGNERHSAKLIRRAKIRNRPLIWHFCRAILRGIAACIVFYALAALYFFTGRPTPNVDYIAILNRPAEQIPPDQRAWPMYRDLHLTFYDHTSEKAATQFADMIYSRPGDADYPQLMSWLESHQRELDIIRAASAKPALGIAFASDGVSGQVRLAPNWFAEVPLGTPTIGVAVGPYQYMVAQEAELLCGDIALAAQSSDANRILRDLADASRIADQLRKMQVLITCNTAISIREAILNRINDMLVERPEAFQDQDLAQLAHMLAKPDSDADLITFEGQRILLRDVVQRIYTNSIFGGGRLTPFGLDALIKSTHQGGDELIRKRPLSPLFIIAGPSRSEILREINHRIDVAQDSLQRPFREVAATYTEVYYRDFFNDPWECIRSLPLQLLSPSIMGAAGAERYLGHRDGILIGIALESYRRLHDGNYPTSLAQLHPALMPSIPEDRITGGELHYRLIDNKPLVYSVGDDLNDDGGKLAPVEKDDPLRLLGHDITARWVKQSFARDGDWVFYPQPAATR